MAVGADSIYGLNMLRHGATGRLFAGVQAPSRVGRSYADSGSVIRRLDAVASRALIGLATQTPQLPGIATGCVIDIDDTVKGVYGPGKQGAEFGYIKIRGLNA